MLKKEVSEVISKGRKIEGKDWWAAYAQENFGRPKASNLVVMIPKKIVKLATRRNRIRRKIRESLWKLLKEQKIRIVIYIRSDNEKIGDEIAAFL